MKYKLSLLIRITINQINLQYHNSLKGCIQDTKNIRCQYDYFNNKCQENSQTNFGCSEQLNMEACVNQLTDYLNNRVYCLFQEKCMNSNEIQLQKYGCQEMFNKYACLKVENDSCTWENQRCKQTNGIDQGDSQICNNFQTPVNPHTCSQIPSAKCMSGGDFECIELRSEQLSQLSCNEIGLNEEGCYALNKQDQYCTFKNGKCQELNLSEIKSCDQKLSKSACLSIKNNDLQCEWFGKQCRTFKFETGQVCVTKNQVNISVCQKSTGLCQYDVSQSKCVNIEKYHLSNLQCNTPGLSKLACLQVINQNCTFVHGKCYRQLRYLFRNQNIYVIRILNNFYQIVGVI